MSTKTIENFFTGKTLVIPSYQRDYAWTEPNVNDLFDDIEEALEVDGGHYLGTFILSQKEKGAPVYVVDGQQRLTTLTMLLDALIDAVENEEIQKHYKNTFIYHPVDGPKLQVLGDNAQFFSDLLKKNDPMPQSDGQERLQKSYRWIRLRADKLRTTGQNVITNWLKCISHLEVLEFTEPNEGKAIRMFQSVNDRGVPLAKMDIVKSLLVYYSNRYLSGKLDEFIAQKFGQAFRSFSRLKKLAAEPGYEIRNINRDTFREDDILRYHYIAFDGQPLGVNVGGDYSATAETVLDAFLKPVLQKLRSNEDNLEHFITVYSEDLLAFFEGLEALIERSRHNREAYLLWVIQDLATTLYPLTIRLHLSGWTDQSSSGDSRKLMDFVALTDLRVFKLRGTNPQADIFRITRTLQSSKVDQLTTDLLAFCERFMPDALMQSRLIDEDMYRNPALSRMLIDVEDKERTRLGSRQLALEELVALNCSGLTVEHILPQDPDNSFDVTSYGFTDGDEYLRHKHRLGNLVLLERNINSACSNRTVEAKMSDPKLYLASEMNAVRAIAAKCAGASHKFDRQAVDKRSSEVAEIVMNHWPIRKRPQYLSENPATTLSVMD